MIQVGGTEVIIQGDLDAGRSEASLDADVGAVHIASTEQVLPGVIASAANSGTPFSLVVARPGPAASPGHPAGVPSAGSVADLTAALSVSVEPTQELLWAGPHHLAVVIPGNTGTGRRQAVQLMQRAAGAGAPLFTWAAARFPRDATNADRLLEVGCRRVDGAEAGHDMGARAVGTGSWLRAGVIWAGVAAAALVGALALGLHRSGHPAASGSGGITSGTASQSGSGTTNGGSGQANGGAVGGSAGLASGTGSTFPGTADTASGQPGSPGGSPGSGSTSGTGTSAGTASGTAGTGSGGGQLSSGAGSSAGSTSSQGSSGSSATTGTGGTGSGTTGSGTNTGTGTSGSGGTGTSGTGSGSGGSGGTGTGGTGTTGTGTGGGSTNQCTGLLNSLTCTLNGLLGGGH